MDRQRNVLILTVGMFFMSAGYTMVVPFLPVYLLELGTPKDQVALWSGAVFSIAFLIAGIMAPIWGKMSDKRGRKLMVLRASFALAVTYMMGAFVQSDWQLLVVRAFQGFANGFYPAAMTLVTISVEPKKVGQAIGIFQTGTICGQVLGPLMGGLVSNWFGMRPSFLSVSIVMFLVFLAVYKLVEEPKQDVPTEPLPDTTIKEDLKLAWHNKALLEILVLFFVVQGSILMLQPIIAIYVGDLIHDMNRAGLISGIILSIAGIVGAIMATYWSRYGQRTTYFRGILIGLTGAGICVFAQGIFQEIWTFAILQIMVNFFGVGISPSLSALVSLKTKPENRGRAYGLVTTFQQFGSMAGPLFASLISTWISIPMVFVITGIIVLLVALQVWRKHRPFRVVKEAL